MLNLLSTVVGAPPEVEPRNRLSINVFISDNTDNEAEITVSSVEFRNDGRNPALPTTSTPELPGHNDSATRITDVAGLRHGQRQWHA